MRNTRFSVALGVLLCVLLPAWVAAMTAADRTDFDNSYQCAGLYNIFIQQDSQWRQVAVLQYNKYLREKKIDLGELVPVEGKLRIRLVQKGGGAAHIDAVLLGGRPPLKIAGTDDGLALKKLARRDFDVLDAHQKTLELVFPSRTKNRLLKLTARVEPANISKVPFQFPSANLFRPLNRHSKFYTYKLQPKNNSRPHPLNKSSKKPFFKELCRTGSGHPSGFTYGWVHNDDRKLYVTLDFTPDNTKDGNKDYARVFVKTQTGLKTFQVSESQTKWGRAEFTYTNKAIYQHKRYHFEIPLKELGLETPSHAIPIQLAFAAYGTAAPGDQQESVAAGAAHTLILKPGGSLWAWGGNSRGQLGDGTQVDRLSPVAAGDADNDGFPDNDWVAVAAGWYHTVALKNNGTLWAWGSNSHGELGDGTQVDRLSPVAAGDADNDGFPDNDWVAVAAGEYYTMALKSNGTLWAWGYNYRGQLGDGSPPDGTAPDRLNPVQVGSDTDWVAVASGDMHTMALKSNGTLWAWGYNYRGQLGDGSTENKSAPVQETTGATDWIAVAAGGLHTAALKSDGTLWAWGFNGSGQLGDDTQTDSIIPLAVGDTDGDGYPDTDWAAVAAGSMYTAALKENGTLWAWGYNYRGQLGDGSTENKSAPVQETTGGSDWVAVAAGGNHTVALKSDGSIWTWGANHEGQLGDGTTTDRSRPVQVIGPDTDDDDLDDNWERIHFGDLSHDGSGDGDSDGLNDLGEYQNNTDPHDFDSDDDWVKDGDEVANGTDPNDTNDFTPSGTGAIRGTVRDASGAPITTDPFDVEVITGDPCGGWQNVRTESSNSDGTYAIVGLAPGQYYLRTDNRNQSNYVNEWWASPSSSFDCHVAQLIDVPENGSADDRNFQLDLGGSISGHARNTAGDPIADLHIYAESYETGEWTAGSNTDAAGDYTLHGLPAGDYRLRSCAQCSGLQFADEFYDNVYNWHSAARVNVTVPGPTPVNDFILEVGHTIRGTVSGLAAGQHIHIQAHSDNGTSQNDSDDLEFWTDIDGDGSGSNSFSLNVASGYFYAVEFSPDDGLRVFYRSAEPYGTWDGNRATRLDLTADAENIDVTIQDDVDGDDMPDDWEIAHFGNLDQGGGNDFDGDGLSNIDEFHHGTLPENQDSDGDKISDKYELDRGTDPNQASDVPPIPIIGSIINIHNPDGSFSMLVEVLIESGFVNGFLGNIPDDIDTITISGPGLSLSKSELTFISIWNEWYTTISGSPQLGTYTFEVTSGSSRGTTFDTQTVIRDIPVADHTKFFPADGATITSSTPTFSWQAVDYPETPLYYRLEINDLAGNRVYASGRVKDMLSAAAPADRFSAGQTYKWRVRAGDSSTWEGEENRSNSQWITFTMGSTLTHSATPGLDIQYNAAGTITWTTNSADPFTALIHEVKVVDYDGIAPDGSSHIVTVTYPNGGPTKTLHFDYSRDAYSANYFLYDREIDQPIDTVRHSGEYIFRVEDPDGNWSEAVDNVVIDPINPPVEASFSPGFGTPQAITAYFDDVYVNGSLYDDFNRGYFDPGKWEGQPSEVSYENGEAKFDKQWTVKSESISMNLKNPQGIYEHAATVRVAGTTGGTDFLFARVGGTYCRDSKGEVSARVGIRENRAYISVYSEYWDGDHLIDESIFSDYDLSDAPDNVSISPGKKYRLTVAWDQPTATFTFKIKGLEDSTDYTRQVAVPGPTGPVDNPGRFIGVSSWVFLDNTTPTFDWNEVTGAAHYRVSIYGLNGATIYKAYPKAPPYTLPPGILKPNAIYKYKIDALRHHQWMDWENAGASDREQMRFITGGEEAQDPYIDFWSHGVYTWNHGPPFGAFTHFYVRIHDAQGVPGNIESVRVTTPGGETVNLYYDEYVSPTCWLYRGTYFGSMQAGTYTFAVTDKNGHIDTKDEAFGPDPIGFLEETSLSPAHNTLINGTAVNFDWDDVPGASFYQLNFYDKDYNYLFNVKSTQSTYSLPPGLLRENELYRYRIHNYREFFEDNIDNGSTSPPHDIWNAPNIITTATHGTASPTINLDSFGVAVWQAPHPATGDPAFMLELMALVSDADGVPQNIARVEVKFPDGSIHPLKYDDSPNWGSNYSTFIFLEDTSSISSGVYEFKVVDFDGNQDTATDTLPEVGAGLIAWPTDVTPADGTIVATTTPTITWDPVPDASYYKVRIMSAFDYPTVHWSGELTATHYTVPQGVLSNGATHGYRVYAFREPVGSEVDFYSCYSYWHAKNNHFTIQLADSDGDGLFDENDNCPHDPNAGQADDDSDTIGDACDNCPDTYNPGQENLDGDAYGDACDTDADGDGYAAVASGGTDCNDMDASIYPGAVEIPGDGIDQDCNGSDSINIAPGNYYVNPASGTDDQVHGSADGSGAWKSLHYALLLVNDGQPGLYTLTLAPGSVYTFASEGVDEPLRFDQDVTVEGSGAVIDGSGDHGTAENPWTTGLTIGMGAANVTLRDLTIRNFKTGVSIRMDGGCVTFENVTLTSCDVGLQLLETYQVDVDLGGITIGGNTTGIEITAASSNNTVRNGTVSANSGDGVRVEASNVAPSSNLITGLQILDNAKNGIAFLDGCDNQVSDCLISGNNTGANPWNHSGYAGVYLTSATTRVKWNTITGNLCAGVFAEEAVAGEIHGNLVTGNIEGIKLSFTSGVMVQSNTVSANSDGLVIEEGSSPCVLGNILWGNVSGTDLVVNGGYTAIEYNDVGTFTLPNLPPNNISEDPQFNDAAASDYTLAYTSPGIDGTNITEPGRDINGTPRPLGKTWDMGAYESTGFADTDNDQLPDWWEQEIVDASSSDSIDSIEDVQPGDDFDGDGVSNWNEYVNGTDPTTAMVVRITQPDASPAYTDQASMTIAGTATADTGTDTGLADVVEVTINGGNAMYIPLSDDPLTDDDPWSANVNLVEGQNIIVAKAIDNDGQNPSTSTSLTVIRDTAEPVITVIDPVYDGAYPIAESDIHITGIASDDTEVVAVRWSRRVVSTGDETTGEATGTESWDTGPIALVDDEIHEITITAEDRFGKTTSVTVSVEQVPGVETQEGEDLSDQGATPAGDPLDFDGDEYLNADETACLPNQAQAAHDATITPSNHLGNTRYPTDPADPRYNPAKVKYDDHGNPTGYLWPDCLNPDDDLDGLPDWWEQAYFNSATAAGSGDNPDGDAFDNQAEYANGTDPTTAQDVMFEVTLHDQDGNDITATYLPAYGGAVRVQARYLYGNPPASVEFSLAQTSAYPGRALNDPDPALYPGIQYPAGYDYNAADFGITQVNPFTNPGQFSYEQGPVTVADSGSGIYTVYLQCWDYGGRTKLQVKAPGASQADAIWVPHGAGTNGIGHSWDYDGDAGTPNPQDPNALDPNADIDKIIFEKPGVYAASQGDGLNNFEEYRGVVYIAASAATLSHARLNPYRKDLFLRAEGFDDAEGDPYDPPAPGAQDPFWLGLAFKNAGIDIHNTTGWGHDATSDGSFFIYYRAGSITGIGGYTNRAVTGAGTAWQTNWPRFEWEFKLVEDPGDEAPDPAQNAWIPIDQFTATGSLALALPYAGTTGTFSPAKAYVIRRPLPNINVLIVRHDYNLKTVLSTSDGYIKFASAFEPGYFNSLGIRNWSWSTKGLGKSNPDPHNYGLAVTLKIPLDHYFNDRPYQKGTVWDPATCSWRSPVGDEQHQLAPLSMVEDYRDMRQPVDGYLPCSTTNSSWDGDKRLSTYADWQTLGTLSPFDINGNGRVELPVAIDPANVDPNTEYTKAEVLRHTITHEIGHAIGVPSHSGDPSCLMYMYSVNWSRQDHLCDWFRSMLDVYNAKQ